MATSVEMHNTGDPALQAEVATAIEHVLSQRSGDLGGFHCRVASE